MKQIGVALVALLSIAGSVTYMVWRAGSFARDPVAATSTPPLPPPMGSKEAKVFVYVAVPPGSVCQEPARQALVELARQYPQQVFIYFAPFSAGIPGAENPSSQGPSLEELGREAPVVEAPFCAFIAVNGEISFSDESHDICLSGPPDDEGAFSLPDLRWVIEREIVAQYGKLPPPAQKPKRKK